MALLEALKIVTNPTSLTMSVEQTRRNKLITKLQEQLCLAEAQLGGSPYKRMRWVVAPNFEGEPVRVQRPVRLKQWWFKSVAGSVLMTVRYGTKLLPIAKDKTAIEVDTVDALPNVIQTLIAAVDAGELDQQIAAVAAERHIQMPKLIAKAGGKRH